MTENPKIKFKALLGYLAFAFLMACSQNPYQHEINIFHDENMVAIFDAADRRDTDKVLQYISHSNQYYRAAAAELMGSIQDSAAIIHLIPLLNDSKDAVQIAAAYALGQIGSDEAAKALHNQLNGKSSSRVKAAILEALGKIVSEKTSVMLSSYQVTNETEALGMTIGLYRLAVRGINTKATAAKALELLQHPSKAVRLYAAHYFNRNSSLEIDSMLDELILRAEEEQDEETCMVITSALRKTKDQKALHHFVKKGLTHPNYQVRVAAARGLSAHSAKGFLNPIISIMQNEKHPHVRTSIAESLLQKAESELYNSLINLTKRETHARSKYLLYAAAMKANPENRMLLLDLSDDFAASKDIYEKTFILNAISHHPYGLPFLTEQLEKSDNEIIRSKSMESIINMLNLGIMSESNKEIIRRDLPFLMMEINDPIILGLLSDLMMHQELNIKQQYQDFSFLYPLREKLPTPQYTESRISLERAIATLNNSPYQAPVNQHNYPIDWEYVQQIPRDSKVKITTNKGSFVVQLLVEKAPGTVSNFVGMVESDYLIGKSFHRVVPNFVAQGGCPRGDGYGSEHFSIRSELANLKYKTGSLGMASAGKDTEGVQFFITHNATPHLDGRYTIFAEVTEGMDVVHQLQIGDTITEANLLVQQ